MAFKFEWSNLGVAAAGLCAVHCAALPLIAGASVMENSLLHSPVVEGGMLGTAALVGYATLGSGFRNHGRPLPLVLLTLGLAVLLAGHHLLPEEFGLPFALGGAALLIAAQVMNRRCPAPCCAHSHCEANAADRPARVPAT